MNKYDKASKLLEQGKVTFNEETDRAFWYSVRDVYWTRYNKQSESWSCTCMSYIYAYDIVCSHVIACKRFKKGK